MFETKQIATILVVSAVIVAGIGAAWFALKDDGERVTIDAALEVYGNANNDDRIDMADIDLIREIIDGVKDFKDYPLADANYDGDVDEMDFAQIDAILGASSQNQVRVHHINHYDGRSEVADT